MKTGVKTETEHLILKTYQKEMQKKYCYRRGLLGQNMKALRKNNNKRKVLHQIKRLYIANGITEVGNRLEI